MEYDTLLKLEKRPYPAGTVSDMGENLRLLTRNESSYIPPLQTSHGTSSNFPIIVPTRRNIRTVSRDITRIMQLTKDIGAGPLIFLCSGAAKKEDIANIAQEFPGLHWLAIDGPFSLESSPHEFKTTDSPISYGGDKDISQKRNFALQLAKVMKWKSLFFLDDDVIITGSQINKARTLINRKNTTIVGFSARSYPDLSVAVHAWRFANNPIDSFIGTGALAIRTDTPAMSFFPHVYNEDWIFLITYCLSKGDVVWAGTVEQRPYAPFKNVRRAEIEEPGDLLGESLLKLAMTITPDLGEKDFVSIAKAIVRFADESYWESEINARIAFLREAQDRIWLDKRPSMKKKHILRALEHSIDRLVGTTSHEGVSPEAMAKWVRAWAHDLTYWNNLQAKMKTTDSLVEAMSLLNFNNSFIYSSGERMPDVAIPPTQLLAAPKTRETPPHTISAAIIQGLNNTKIIEDYLQSKKLDISYLVDCANRLRFDRPTATIASLKPKFTVCYVIEQGESIEQIRHSVKQLVTLNQSNQHVQLILWVRSHDKTPLSSLERYRNVLVGRLVRDLAGTNIFLRSSVSHRQEQNVDHVIDSTIDDLAFAYWKCNIPARHQIFVVNSQNDLLRYGSFWEFMNRQHSIPRGPLSLYLQDHLKISNKKTKHLLSSSKDKESLMRARLTLSESSAFYPSTLLQRRPTKRMVRIMEKARFTWVQIDELAYSAKYHHEGGEDELVQSRKIVSIIVPYQTHLPHNKGDVARELFRILDKEALGNKPINCFIVIRGAQSDEWAKLEKYRIELMTLISSGVAEKKGILTSIVYQDFPLRESDQKRRLTALATYLYWLQNDQEEPIIRWHELAPLS